MKSIKLSPVTSEWNDYWSFFAVHATDLNKIESGNDYLYIMNDSMMSKAKEIAKANGGCTTKARDLTVDMFMKSYGFN